MSDRSQEPIVEPVNRGPHAVSRSVVVDIPAEVIFARLENPHRHHEIDGSGTVLAAVAGPETLYAGDTFTMDMQMFGIPYRITSRVVRLVPGRDIEWRHPAGHTWRWQLEPLSPARTRVVETWDYTHSRAGWAYRLIGLPKRNARGIEQTLRGLEAAIAG